MGSVMNPGLERTSQLVPFETSTCPGSLPLVLLSSQFWPMPSMSRGVINCAKQFLSHPFSRIKSFDQWAVDRDPVLTSTTSAKIGKTAIHGSHVSFVAHPTISNIALSCEWRFTSDRVTPRLPGWSTWHGYGIQQALLATRYLNSPDTCIF